MSEKFYKQLGENIKQHRLKQHLTQQQLADKIGKGLNFVGKVEVAFSRPSLNTVIDIAKALNISVSELTKDA
jgi:transcriptional regulator with XRE-family HTH domain